MRMKLVYSLSFLVLAPCAASSQSVPVNVDNFKRAETDFYMRKTVDDGGLGKFVHSRAPTPIDKQPVVRMNRDTLYSQALFDLDAGPVTITLPDAGKRFVSMQIINEDHYTPMVVYKPGRTTLTRDKVGTRYVFVAVRILVDPNDTKDLAQVHALQDALKVEQKSVGKFEAPNWDLAQQKKIREALEALSAASGSFTNAFGPKGEGRSGQAPDRHGSRLGRQPRQGRILPLSDPGQKRRQDGLQAQGQGGPRRCVLVDQRL